MIASRSSFVGTSGTLFATSVQSCNLPPSSLPPQSSTFCPAISTNPICFKLAQHCAYSDRIHCTKFQLDPTSRSFARDISGSAWPIDLKLRTLARHTCIHLRTKFHPDLRSTTAATASKRCRSVGTRELESEVSQSRFGFELLRD